LTRCSSLGMARSERVCTHFQCAPANVDGEESNVRQLSGRRGWTDRERHDVDGVRLPVAVDSPRRGCALRLRRRADCAHVCETPGGGSRCPTSLMAHRSPSAKRWHSVVVPSLRPIALPSTARGAAIPPCQERPDIPYGDRRADRRNYSADCRSICAIFHSPSTLRNV
jgi:hypothetical protein